MKLDFAWLHGADFREMLFYYRATGEGYDNIREFIKMRVDEMLEKAKINPNRSDF